MTTQEESSKFTKAIGDGLEKTVDWVIDERSAHYEADASRMPRPVDVDSIIRRYSVINAGIAGALNLVPGPLGLIAVVPEILLVMRNQLAMIYDIGVAHGKRMSLTASLLVGLFATGATGGALGLLVIQGNKVFVKRASLRVLQRIIAALAGSVTQKVLKQILAKWIPVVGAAAMATWAGLSTRNMGRRAAEILAKEIVEVDDAQADAADGSAASGEATQVMIEFQKRHIACLINLLHADRLVRPREVDFIEEILKRSLLPESDKATIRERIGHWGRLPVNLNVFKDDVDATIALLSDLVALAKRDGEFHASEKVYLREVAKELGCSEGDIAELTEASA